MTNELRALHLVGATGKSRTEMKDGKEYLVVPVVALMEGAIHAVNSLVPEFVPFSTIQKAAASWNGRPITVGHPTRDGKQCSANDPGIFESHVIGTIFESRADEGSKKLLQEAWIEKAKAKMLSPAMYERLAADQTEEVSVGAFVTTGPEGGTDHRGKVYKGTWHGATGDHLAFSPGGRGACSVEMGCGTHRAAMRVCGNHLELLGDVEGHEFHGNQYTAHGAASSAHETARAAHKEAAAANREAAKPGASARTKEIAESKSSKADQLSRNADAATQGIQDKGMTRVREESTAARYSADDANRANGESDNPTSHDFSRAADHHSSAEIAHRQASVSHQLHDRPKKLNEHKPENVIKAIHGLFKGRNLETLQSDEADVLLDDLRVAAGARHSASDMKMIQTMHDHAVKLGADCGPDLRDMSAITTLEGASLDERMQAVSRAVEKEFSQGNGLVSPSTAYAYPQTVYDDRVVIRKGDKLWQVNYALKDGEVTFVGAPVEVKQVYVVEEGALRVMGDVPGHEFHGNQFSGGGGGGSTADRLEKTHGLSKSDATKFANYEIMHGTKKMEEVLQKHLKKSKGRALEVSFEALDAYKDCPTCDGTGQVSKDGKQADCPSCDGEGVMKEMRTATIKHEGGRWTLYTKDGSRRLGTHDTEAEAKAQEAAIEAAKQRRNAELSAATDAAPCGCHK